MIRRAVACPADLAGVWRLGQRFHAERAEPAGFPPLDTDKAYRNIALHLDRFPAFVAERDGEIVGALLLYLVPCWYAAAHTLTDMLFYVLPERRGRGEARELIRAAVALKHEYRCRLLLTTSSGLVGPAINRFYRSLGLRQVGAAYLME